MTRSRTASEMHVTGTCHWCKQAFSYIQLTKQRYYCGPKCRIAADRANSKENTRRRAARRRRVAELKRAQAERAVPEST